MALKSENRTVAEVNKDYIIKWQVQTEKAWNLISAGQYHKLVGEKLSERHFKKVLLYEQEQYVFLRKNHLRIKFILR